MALYRTTFPIDARPEVVWGVLADFERYPEWNPSLPSIAGDLRVGTVSSSSSSRRRTARCASRTWSTFADSCSRCFVR